MSGVDWINADAADAILLPAPTSSNISAAAITSIPLNPITSATTDVSHQLTDEDLLLQPQEITLPANLASEGRGVIAGQEASSLHINAPEVVPSSSQSAIASGDNTAGSATIVSIPANTSEKPGAVVPSATRGKGVRRRPRTVDECKRNIDQLFNVS